MDTFHFDTDVDGALACAEAGLNLARDIRRELVRVYPAAEGAGALECLWRAGF